MMFKREHRRDAESAELLAMELHTGRVTGPVGVLLLAGAVAYVTIAFAGIIPPLALGLWSGCFALVLAAWASAILVLWFGDVPADAVVGIWLPVGRGAAIASNILTAISPWLFLPAAGLELRGLMMFLYIWYVLVQTMAETHASGVSGSAALIVLGSLAAYELRHPTAYSVPLGIFLLIFAASVFAFQKLIRRSVLEAVRARLAAERSERGLDRALRDVAGQRDAITRFLAAASHDLQQPVQAASLFFDQAVGSREAEPRLRAIEGARRAFASAQDLLEQMLEHLRAESGVVQMRREPVPLGPLFVETLSDHEPRLVSAGIAAACAPTSLCAYTDPRLVRRVLGNLLVNAATHSRASRLLVGTRRDGDAVHILVIDNGRGIDRAEAELLFQDYASGPDAPASSFGLGLPASARIATSMGGSLMHDARWRQGSCFVLSLPLALSRG